MAVKIDVFSKICVLGFGDFNVRVGCDKYVRLHPTYEAVRSYLDFHPMHITKHTSDELVLQHKFSLYQALPSACRHVLVGGAFVLCPFLIAYGSILSLYNAGSSAFSCQRISNQVQCTSQQTYLCGLLRKKTTSVENVLGAITQPTNYKKSSDLEIILHSPKAAVKFASFPGYQSDTATDAAQQITYFLESANSSSLELRYTHISTFLIVSSIFGALIGSISIIYLARNFLIRSLIQDFQVEALILNKPLNSFTYKQYFLNFNKTKLYALDEIEAIEFYTSFYQGKEVYVGPKFILSSSDEFYFLNEPVMEPLNRNIAYQVRAFLGLQLDSGNIILDQENRETVLQQQNSYYWTSHQDEPALRSPYTIKQLHRKLIALDFKFMEDLHYFHVTDIYIYSHINEAIYALNYVFWIDDLSNKLEHRHKCDSYFFTQFACGAVLMVSSTPLKHQRRKKFFGYSYVDLDTVQLYEQHRQRIEELSSRHGNPIMIPDLKAMAVALEKIQDPRSVTCNLNAYQRDRIAS